MAAISLRKPNAKLWFLVLMNVAALLYLTALVAEIIFHKSNPPIPDIVMAHMPGSAERIIEGSKPYVSYLLQISIRLVFGLVMANLVIAFDAIKHIWELIERRKKDLSPIAADILFYLVWTSLGVLVVLFTGFNYGGMGVGPLNWDQWPGQMFTIPEPQNDILGVVGMQSFWYLFTERLIKAVIVGSLWPLLLRKYRAMFFPFIAIKTLLIFFYGISMGTLILKGLSHPLPEGKTRTQIESIANKVGFDTSRLHEWVLPLPGATVPQLNGAHIYITSPEKFKWTLEETTAVVGHELGHWKYYDLWTGYGIKLATEVAWVIPTLWIAANPQIYAAFGLATEPLIVGVAITDLFRASFENFWKIFTLFLQRTAEYRADAHASSLGYSLEICTSLLKIHQVARAPVTHTRLFEYLFHTHPSIENRMKAVLNK